MSVKESASALIPSPSTDEGPVYSHLEPLFGRAMDEDRFKINILDPSIA